MSIIDLIRRLLGGGHGKPQQPSQPGVPSRIVEYRDVSDPGGVATIYYMVKNAVYGGKPARITFYVTPRLFTIKHIRITVECCGKTIVDELEDVDTPITVATTIPFPGFDDGYTVRDVKITVEYAPGKGIEYQERCEWHGGVCVPRIIVPRWTGPETVVSRYAETITWYRDISAVKPIIEVKAPKTPLRYPEAAEIQVRLRDPPFTSQYMFYAKFEGDYREEECRCGGKTIIQDDVRVRIYRVEDTLFMEATPLSPGEHTLTFRACVASLSAENGRLVEAEKKCSDVYTVKITWTAPHSQPTTPPGHHRPRHTVTVHVHGGAGGYILVDGVPAGTYGFAAGGNCATPGVVEVDDGEHVIQACEKCAGTLAGVETNIASCSFPYRVRVTGDVELDAYNLGCVMDGGRPYIGVVYLYSKQKRFSYRVDDEASYRFSFPDGTAIIPLRAGKHLIHIKGRDIEVDVRGGSYRVIEV